MGNFVNLLWRFVNSPRLIYSAIAVHIPSCEHSLASPKGDKLEKCELYGQYEN